MQHSVWLILFTHTLTTRLWIWELTVWSCDYLHVGNVGKYCFSSYFRILFNLNKTIKIKQVLCSGVHSYGIWCDVIGQMVSYMLRQQWGIIRPLKMIPLCCLETLGTNHPVKWYHISEDWRPQLEHCNSLKPHTGLLPCFHHFEKEKKQQ